MSRRKRMLLFAPLAILALALFIFVGGEVVRLLWNWLLPTLFGWKQITFWQAVGLLALCRILFGGLGRHGWGRRTSDMSPEEREQMRQRIRERWMGKQTAEESKGQ